MQLTFDNNYDPSFEEGFYLDLQQDMLLEQADICSDRDVSAALFGFASGEYTRAEEGMKTQDFLRWGIEGLLLGLYFASHNRIKKRLSVGIIKLSEGKNMENKISQYLPDYTDYIKAKGILIKLQAELEYLSKNIETLTVEKVNASLDRSELSKVKDITKTDWSLVVKSFIFSTIFSMVGPGFVGITMGLVFDKRGKHVGKRGWTNAKLKEEMRALLKIINETDSLSKSMKNSKSQLSTKLSNADKVFISKMTRIVAKSYRELGSVLGRGLAAPVFLGSR